MHTCQLFPYRTYCCVLRSSILIFFSLVFIDIFWYGQLNLLKLKKVKQKINRSLNTKILNAALLFTLHRFDLRTKAFLG